MKDRWQIARFAGTLALIGGCAMGKTERTIAPEVALSIRVYDHAQVTPALLNSAENETGRLFQAAGIRIVWEHPLYLSSEDEGTDMTYASSPPPNGRPYLVIRFIRRLPADVLPGALGYSLPFARRGAHVLILYDRVEALTRKVNTADYTVLGHAMAHELGHVLLGSAGHTTGGLMQGRWTPASWRLAVAGLLAFDAAEKGQIRAGVLKLRSPAAKSSATTALQFGVAPVVP